MKSYLNKAIARFVIPISLIFIGSIAFFSVCFSQEVKPPADPLAGRKVFVNKGCVNCHSIYGKGGKVGRDLGRTLTHLGPTGIFAMMWNHSPEMAKLMQKPQRMPTFSEQEMTDLMAFIYFLRYFDQKGDAEKGRMVLKRKRCLRCHKVGRAGGSIGPPLDKVRNYAPPLSLAQTMWNHGMKMSAKISALGVQRPTFTGPEIRDLFAYLGEVNTHNMDTITYLKPGRPQVGERLFADKGCVQCHKIGNKGKSVGPDLTRVDFHGGVTQIAATLWNHSPKMLARMEEREIAPPIFEENEMADLAAYLYFLDFTEQKGDVEEGKGLFTRKGCVKCHAIKGEGGNVGPDLARSDRTVDYIKTTAAMWNHNQKMRILMEKVGVPMPRFDEKEMRDLFFYLRTERMKYEY